MVCEICNLDLMDKFYLVKLKSSCFESGTLIKCENQNLSVIHPKNSSFPNDCTILDDWIEISELKMNFLLKREMSKRLEIHQSNLFERIEQLKPFDECYIIDKKYRERCLIIERKFQNHQFVVKRKDKKPSIISILDIDLIVNIEYFICLSKSGGIEAGMIIIDEDKTRKTYPDGYLVCNSIDKIEKISREKFFFLCKYPCEERLKIHEEKLWETINELNVGDRCCLVSKFDHPSYDIIGKDVKEDTVEYIVQTVIGYLACVDQTEIRPGSLKTSAEGRGDSVGATRSARTTIDRNVNTRTRTSSVEERSLMAKTTYFESTILDPRSLVSFEQIISDEWINDTEVEFRLGDSYKKYRGELKWIGLINKVMSAAVFVKTMPTGDPLQLYTCSKEIIDRINLPMTDNLVIVLLATVNRSETNDESEYWKSILRFLQTKNLFPDILIDVIASDDIRVLNFMAKQWSDPIDLERYPDLLPTLIRQDHYEVIALLLNHFVASINDNVYLLNVAKYFLLIDDYKTFIAAAKKCTDANFILGNGETFLSDIVKDSDDENVINRAIGSNLFNVNKSNENGDSPLVLACRKLMVSTVRLLLANGAIASYENNMALNTVIDLRNNNSDMVQLQRALEIIAIFTKEIRLDHNMCTICMDRHINTALNCGHTMCDLCSIQLQNCPECNRDVIERIRIFLP